MPLTPASRDLVRIILRWVLAAAFAYVGYVHISHPDFFLPIVPVWVPQPRLTVTLTGWCELAGALGLLVPRLRWIAGVMLALYAVCVFPANIKHALEHVTVGHGTLGWWYHGPRLLFQPVIVWWCLFAGRVIDWPFLSRTVTPAKAGVSDDKNAS
jgi:uncharacterized membrane protein